MKNLWILCLVLFGSCSHQKPIVEKTTGDEDIPEMPLLEDPGSPTDSKYIPEDIDYMEYVSLVQCQPYAMDKALLSCLKVSESKIKANSLSQLQRLFEVASRKSFAEVHRRLVDQWDYDSSKTTEDDPCETVISSNMRKIVEACTIKVDLP